MNSSDTNKRRMVPKPIYGAEPINVQPAKLDDATLLAIGRLIRACAEIEDVINLFICNLAEINESRMVVLLGMSPISKRVQIASYLAKINSKEAQELASWVFNEGFTNTYRCRNDVAHGILLGRNDDGAWSFLTAKTEEPEGPSAIQIVASYTTEFIQDVADAAEEAIPTMERKLKIEELRQARIGKPLQPHRRANQKHDKGRKPKKG